MCDLIACVLDTRSYWLTSTWLSSFFVDASVNRLNQVLFFAILFSQSERTPELEPELAASPGGTLIDSPDATSPADVNLDQQNKLRF